MLFKKWTEVYNTSDMEKFFKAKNVLYDQNITYKTDTLNNTLRLSSANRRGANLLLGRSGSIKNSYSISVHPSDEPKARHLLSKL